ncbi:recombinase family protein [Streptomyces sp. NPDC058646]|uniref:recombinase family protein n=1 Tax=Streptomyces sp. NPDC058646 TaxID=3346574 RepID=UPI0036547500
MTTSDVGLQFLTGDLQGSHNPSGVVFTVWAALSGMEREYIRDRTLQGHESARKRGKAIGGAGVTGTGSLGARPTCLHMSVCRQGGNMPRQPGLRSGVTPGRCA